jgi:hypothetical protein
MIFRAALLFMCCTAAIPSAQAQPNGEQGHMRKNIRAGTLLSPREVEQRILPTMPGMQYLGPEYDPAAMAYRLKFIRQGKVSFVDVDARTGAVIGQSR